MKTTTISISGVIKAYTKYPKGYGDAYCFSRQLASMEKHPIILNYKSQLTSIRKQLGLSDYKFRKQLNSAIAFGLITKEGKHLRLFSKNQDKKFKPNRKNDYRNTKNPKALVKILLFEYYYKSQYKSYKAKSYQTVLSGSNKSDCKSIISYTENIANPEISCSVRGIANLFHCSISTAHGLIKEMENNGHIKVKKNYDIISYSEFQTYLAMNRPNIRYSNGTYYYIKASTYTMKTSSKRKEFEPFYSLPEHIQNDYLSKGYSIAEINILLSSK